MADEEDVKPKMNLTINYEEQKITVKVKPNTKFEKIFEAAEKRFGKTPGTLRFLYDGSRVQGHETPGERDMEDGDIVEAHLFQIGG
jgi:hypothetical protein